MKIYFWGTRGSYPASCSGLAFGHKLANLLDYVFDSLPQKISKQELKDFIAQKTPFWLTHNYGTNTLCVQVDIGSKNEFILCDAGTGIIDFAKYVKNTLNKPQGNIFHIFISHLHHDHIQGFPFFALAFGKGNRIIIHGYHEKIKEAFQVMMANPFFPVPLSHITSELIFNVQRPQTPFEIGFCQVRGLMQNHPGVSYGYRFEHDKKIAIYSTDCEHTKAERSLGHPFVQFCKDADILMFDAMSSFAEQAQVGWGHSTYKIGIELALWAKIKQLVFLHHDPQYTDEQLYSLVNLSLDYKKTYQSEHVSLESNLNIKIAHDGLELEV